MPSILIIIWLLCRIDPAELSRRDDHVGPQSVDDVRRKLLSKIQTNVMQRRNQVLADRRSRGWEPDENSPLIGGDRRETEDYDTVSYDNASQHSLPFMVRILKFTVDAITIN